LAQHGPVVVDGLNAVFPRNFDDRYVGSLRAGGVTGIHVTVPDVESFSESYVVGELTELFHNIRTLGHLRVRLTTTVKEIRQAKEEGGIAVVLGAQGSGFLGQDLHTMDFYRQLGMRIMQPTYQTRNQFGSGCGEKVDEGLSNLGVEWVGRMNELNMLISLSHVGPRTSMDVMEISKDPVVFTHSNSKALCNHIRNITDEEIETCAEKGGVVGLVPIGMFVSDSKELKDITVEDFIRHIDYVVRLVGVDHVGLGLDIAEEYYYSAEDILRKRRLLPTLTSSILQNAEDEFLRSGKPKVRHDALYVPPWLQRMSDFPIIVKGLKDAGYSEQDIDKILGENFLRVFEEVWGS
jgi:membrane dipeptidase